MPRFCEKAAIVEAERVTHRNIYRLAKRCGGRYVHIQDREWIVLQTDEGQVKVQIGDWLIQERNGRFCMCAPDVFEQNYEPLRSGKERCCHHVAGVAITDTLVDQIAERVAARLSRAWHPERPEVDCR